ncbi:catalase family protein [Maricurvus nonylphenolicus]|uniref:catalase family protein n=1 Tax=Maricurvus nonylphenolicus TaxID=1008307 RepID=UPI0036F43BDE
MKTFTRLAINAALLAAIPLSANAEQSPIIVDTLGMDIAPQEIEAIQTAMRLGPMISEAAEKVNGLPYRRDAHAKATGCVRATFSVNGDIPEHFQHSVFSQPGREYQAWVRFSNGDMTVQADKKPDARGMAIKLINVDGEKIAPELHGPKTQDFVMANTPAFFHRNIYDYIEDMKSLAKLDRTGWFIGLWPPHIHPKQLYRAKQAVSAVIETPLKPQYFSMTPYQLGDTILKFSAKACPGMTFDKPDNTDDNDYLTEVMQKQLQTGAACFDFMVQEKKAGKDMPLDDATVIWSEKDSPFIPIARVNIPPQTFTSEAQMTFCENISMNPWHGVNEWQPLGSLNRSRRLVYHAVSQFRHNKNGAKQFEPDSWCIDGKGSCDIDKIFHTYTDKPEIKYSFDSQYYQNK